MQPYSKPWLTIDQQIQLLEDRGVIVSDYPAARSALARVGYYRLSGYLYPYRRRSTGAQGETIVHDDFASSIRFEDVLLAHDFDRRLRVLLWEAIECIESAVRVAIAHQVGRRGAMAHCDPSCLDPNVSASELHEFSLRLSEATQRSREEFMNHFRRKYGGDVPIWASVEVWDFGMLTRFYGIMHEDDRMAVCRVFGIHSWTTFQSWLKAINILRNQCAHHCRINRRVFTLIPRFPKLPEFAHINVSGTSPKRLYVLLCSMAHLMRSIDPHSLWRKQVVGFFAAVGSIHTIDIDHYGIPQGWTTQALWSV